ncbi:cysteine-rich receptor-like protein kinase 29 [Olea europaea var. sylvestris]|uniref:cysteine-rich receptor-like protein kinase 29 n=1 Tax=Olea europaea var. sylvestris TaxID=158386 RepID=UPI000C1D0260|nr:cysteine-rich receptor-like protein kinase 29 [Olea europaea var. sylvestris]
MSSWKWLAFIFLNMTYLFGYVKSQCGTNGNYTSNSTYRANLNTLLSSLSSNMDSNGFYNASIGENSDRVNAIALCRGDVQLDTCRSCINNATLSILQSCPYQQQANFRDPSDWCMLRYSNEYIFGTLATSPMVYRRNLNNVTSPDDFYRDLRTLLDDLRSRAANGDSLKKFASGNRSGPDFLTIYGLVQCTPDLTSEDCSECLNQVTQVIPGCCTGSPGFGAFAPSCLLQYETNLFYNDTPQLAPPAPPPPPPISAPPGNDDNTTRTIIITIVPIVVSLMLALCIGVVLRMRQKSKQQEIYKSDNEISTVESLHYDFGTIRAATNSFSDANKLGQGGFGIVYKGTLPSGQEIDVKRLSMNSGQGDLEFKNEVLLMTRLQHRNVWKNWREGTIADIIDPELRTSRSLREIMRCIHIGLLCVQEDAADRPTMAAIVLMLTSFSITLPIPSQPAFFVSSRFDPEISLLQEHNSIPSEAMESSKNRSGNSTDASINDISMSDLYPR